jgi:hypothetical protein
LRSVDADIIDWLYEKKAETGKPLYKVVEEILRDYIEKDPATLAARQQEARKLCEEYAAADIKKFLR